MAESRKQELMRELAQARQKISVSRVGLSESLQVGEKINGNLTRYRGAWLAGALITGLAIAKLPARTKKVPVPVVKKKGEEPVKKAAGAGLGLMTLKFVFDVGKPFLMSYLTKQMRGRI